MADFDITISDGTSVEVVITPSSGTGAGVTDHGALTGLGDDDHSAVYVRYTIGSSPPVSPRTGDFWLVTS